MQPMLRHPLRFPRDHRFTLEHASDYLDGELDEAGRARVEQHARFCPKCHELLASLRRTLNALRELRSTDDAAGETGIADGVIARLRDER
jgi:predicted anti-sigma-YlaC factor YlaD